MKLSITSQCKCVMQKMLGCRLDIVIPNPLTVTSSCQCEYPGSKLTRMPWCTMQTMDLIIFFKWNSDIVACYIYISSRSKQRWEFTITKTMAAVPFTTILCELKHSQLSVIPPKTILKNKTCSRDFWVRFSDSNVYFISSYRRFLRLRFAKNCGKRDSRPSFSLLWIRAEGESRSGSHFYFSWFAILRIILRSCYFW